MVDKPKITGSNFLKRPNLSKPQLVIFVVIFAFIGGYFLWKSFAAAPIVNTLEGEHLVLPGGARDSQEVWNGTSNNFKDPSGFGKVTLAGAVSAPSGPGIVAATTTHIVDGQLNESDWALTQNISKSVIGAGNNTAIFGAVWDSKYLYLGAKLLDSNLKNDSVHCWDDDSVEFYIDPNNDGGTKYDSLDKQLTQRWNDSALCGNNGASTSGVLHAWSNISGGYSVELAIPWSSLGVTPSSGKTLGIDAGYNDDDNGGSRDVQAMWNGTANNYKDPSGFGHLNLLAAATPVISGAVAQTTAVHTTDGNLNEADWNVNTSVAKSVIGTANNTSKFGAMWDSNYLYVGVKVLDSSIHKDSTNCWDDDSVELYIDPTNAAGTTYTLHDKQLTQRWNDSALCGLSASTAGVLHNWANISGGYSVEYAVPWSSLGVTPSAGMTIGLDVGVNDDDGTGMIYNDTSASGGQALAMTKVGATSGTVSLASNASSIGVLAHANSCGSGWPTMTVAIDGTNVINAVSVSSSSWATYSANLNLAAGSHSVAITYGNGYSDAACSRNLDLDNLIFYGPITVTPPPTVTLSASPASVTAGVASTLTWNSTNTTGCSASGSWSGGEPLSGSVSTGALNTNSTYTLTCSGSGGSTAATATIVVSAPPVSTPSLASRVGVAVPNIGTENVDQSYGLKIKADDGITLIRSDASLSATYGSGATPNWLWVDRYDNFIKNAGDTLLPIFWTAPQWEHPNCTYSPNYKCPPEPAYYSTWSDQVVQNIDHMEAAGLNIPEIEYWNEPYCCSFWAPKNDPAAYVALLRVLAPKVWAKYPSMKILVSANYLQEGNSVTAPGAQWFSMVLAADNTNLINDPRIILTTHNYTQTDPPTKDRGTGWSFDKYKLAHDQSLAHGKVNPHIEITEFGWEADTGVSYFGAVSETLQAQYMKQALQMAFATGYVDKAFIFEEKPGDNWGYNMHRADGTARPVTTTIKNYINTGN
jgi:hypothetical protein